MVRVQLKAKTKRRKPRAGRTSKGMSLIQQTKKDVSKLKRVVNSNLMRYQYSNLETIVGYGLVGTHSTVPIDVIDFTATAVNTNGLNGTRIGNKIKLRWLDYSFFIKNEGFTDQTPSLIDTEDLLCRYLVIYIRGFDGTVSLGSSTGVLILNNLFKPAGPGATTADYHWLLGKKNPEHDHNYQIIVDRTFILGMNQKATPETPDSARADAKLIKGSANLKGKPIIWDTQFDPTKQAEGRLIHFMLTGARGDGNTQSQTGVVNVQNPWFRVRYEA